MNRQTDLWADAPAWLDVIDADNRIVYANALQHEQLGFAPQALIGASMDLVYPAAARRFVERAQAEGRVVQGLVVLRRADGGSVRVVAGAEPVRDAELGDCVRLVKQPVDLALPHVEKLERDNEVLSSIISTARDASYCIEFLEPVDLTAPEHEIVRQVFENQCVWRYCNEAMAQLYKLPIGDDLNRHSVREVFPRNADNEAFVRTLLESGFHIDGVLSRDHRYDGVDVFIENDVRGEVRVGQLFRFWGTVRDLSARRTRERELVQQVNTALDILGALPDPVLLVNFDGRIVGANPAVEWKLGWQVDSVLGVSIDGVLDAGIAAGELTGSARPAALAASRAAMARCHDGRRLGCRATITSIADDSQPQRCAIVLRFPAAPEARKCAAGAAAPVS
jgi:PAS domain-containing protein